MSIHSIFRMTALFAVVAMAGCQTTSENPDDPMLFGRVDCRRQADSMEVKVQYEQDSAICLGRAQVAADSGTSAMHGAGLVGGLDKAITHDRIGRASVISCMAERGYLYKKRSEHFATCEALKAAKEAPRRR